MTCLSRYSISQLASRFGLSRGTLLHYDAIGLLKATERSRCNYRIYDHTAYVRLERICLYRKAGLSLNEIRLLLDDRRSQKSHILEQRIEETNTEMSNLREQQRVLSSLLTSVEVRRRTRGMDQDTWVEILSNTGLDEENMRMWHVQFERTSPQGHQDFLESLGIPPAEIEVIRAESRE